MFRSILVLVAVGAIVGLDAMIQDNATPAPVPVKKPEPQVVKPAKKDDDDKKPVPHHTKPPHHGHPKFPFGVSPAPEVVQAFKVLKEHAFKHNFGVSPAPEIAQAIKVLKEHDKDKHPFGATPPPEVREAFKVIKEHGGFKHPFGVSPPPEVVGALKVLKEHGFKHHPFQHRPHTTPAPEVREAFKVIKEHGGFKAAAVSPAPEVVQALTVLKEHGFKEHGHRLGVSPRPHAAGHGFKLEKLIAHIHVIEAAVKEAKERKVKEGEVPQVCLPLADVEAGLRAAKRHWLEVVSRLADDHKAAPGHGHGAHHVSPHPHHATKAPEPVQPVRVPAKPAQTESPVGIAI